MNQKTREINISEEKDYVIREMNGGDLSAVDLIGRSSFSTDRFHWDARIPKKVADESRAQWVVNSYKKGLAEIVYVAEYNNEVVGFVTGNIRKDSENILETKTAKSGLMAVHPRLRGKGIGKALAMRKIKWAYDIGLDQVEVGTQSHNKVVRLYEDIGYRVVSTDVTFHKHI